MPRRGRTGRREGGVAEVNKWPIGRGPRPPARRCNRAPNCAANIGRRGGPRRLGETRAAAPEQYLADSGGEGVGTSCPARAPPPPPPFPQPAPQPPGRRSPRTPWLSPPPGRGPSPPLPAGRHQLPPGEGGSPSRSPRGRGGGGRGMGVGVRRVLSRKTGGDQLPPPPPQRPWERSRGRGRAPASLPLGGRAQRPRAGAEPKPNKARPEREPRVKQPGLFLPVSGGAQRRRRTLRRPPAGAAAPDLPRSPAAAAAALFLSCCCCCTGRGLDTRLGLLLAARTEFICRLVWVAGGEGGNPPTTGASSRRGERREPRGGRLAAAGGGEGGEDLQAGVLLLPPRRLAREAEEPPAAGFPERWLWGTLAPRSPSPAPPKIPLLKEPRGPARLKPVAAPWQEEPLTPL